MSNFTPQEQQYLAQLEQKVLMMESRVNSGMMATLTPPSTERRIQDEVPFEEVPVKDPMPWLPVTPGDIAWSVNDRVLTLTNGAINTQAVQRLGFDTPSAVYAITAAVRTTDGAAIPGSFGSVLDTFQIQFRMTNPRLWQTNPVSGSTVCGTAERPRFLGRPCWRMNTGSVLIANITPLMANLNVDLNIWVLETIGCTNILPNTR